MENQPYDPVGHIKILASDFKKNYSFYKDIFEALDYKQVSNKENSAGWAKNGYSILLGQAKIIDYPFKYGMPGIHHICLKAESTDKVDELYNLAIKKEVHIYEPPKKYPNYTNKYYAVFFADPDGMKIEIAYY
ncbi:MAG: VOC family protein [Patescibacteria group bacterium]|jgi:catechol 2,3-dioxygenase-like lactoylglutathione lyase family enzyme